MCVCVYVYVCVLVCAYCVADVSQSKIISMFYHIESTCTEYYFSVCLSSCTFMFHVHVFFYLLLCVG